MLPLALAMAGASLVFNPLGSPLLSNVGFGLLNAVAVHKMIPRAAPALKKIGLLGRDRLKKDRPETPESLGIVVGVVYIFTLLFFIPFLFYKYLVTATVGGGTRVAFTEELAAGDDDALGLFPHSRLSEYLSALLSLQSMLTLGFADDLFDIRWRHKFFLPSIAAIPMLIIYYVDFGVTQVVVPPFMRYVGVTAPTLDLGWIYYVYMGALAIFCTNCINIYAGVNGLEVGQSVVLAACVLANDLLYIFGLPAGHPAVSSHLFSAYLLIPFLGGSIALLRANWWPAKVFVGDTYCYLSGMVFAVIGILGHFSKTLLSMFGPQIFNFIYSIPQLLRIVPCPRHRMPVLNEKTGLLEPSTADVTQCSRTVRGVLRALSAVGLLGLWDTADGKVLISNMTLINLTLVRLGPMREDKLTRTLLAAQLAWGIAAVVGRHMVAALVFGRDNW